MKRLSARLWLVHHCVIIIFLNAVTDLLIINSFLLSEIVVALPVCVMALRQRVTAHAVVIV